MTPRRAAWARSKREVWVGKRSATCLAIRGAGGGHADEDRSGPGADACAGLFAERGVGLVADDHRVGVRDPLGIAYEPLIGLDRHRPVRFVAAVQQWRAQPFLVAAIRDLADELVNQVAAVGEDQNSARAGRIDEADRSDRLAGAGRMFEPEAAIGTRVVTGGYLSVDILVFIALLIFFGPVQRFFVFVLFGGFEVFAFIILVSVFALVRFILVSVFVLVGFGHRSFFDGGEFDRIVVGRDLLFGEQLGQGA